MSTHITHICVIYTCYTHNIYIYIYGDERERESDYVTLPGLESIKTRLFLAPDC